MYKIKISLILSVWTMLLFSIMVTAQGTTPGQLTFYIRLDGAKPIISQKTKGQYKNLSDEELKTKVQITTGLKFINELPNKYVIDIKSDKDKVLSGSNKQYTLASTDDIKFFKIKVSLNAKEIKVFDNVGKDFKPLAVVAVDPPVPAEENVTVNHIITNKSKIVATDRSELYVLVEKIVNKDYKYIGGQSNIIIDKNGIIQIFLDEDGNPIYTGYPTTARSNYDKFQFHIITKNKHNYTFNTDCTFQVIEISAEVSSHSGEKKTDMDYYEIKSQIFSPCSNTFPFKIAKDGVQVVDWEVKLLSTSRVSIGTSVIASWLKNPENISIFTLADGTQTLIADNPDTRGYLGLFLTFHFVPRNINIQPRTPWERFGMSVGTNLNDKAFQNFFVGLNFEVTNGLFINGGVHYGQVNYVIGYDDFKYGKDSFAGALEIRRKWEIGGPYVAVNIDAALFAKVFKNILSPPSSSQTP